MQLSKHKAFNLEDLARVHGITRNVVNSRLHRRFSTNETISERNTKPHFIPQLEQPRVFPQPFLEIKKFVTNTFSKK